MSLLEVKDLYKSFGKTKVLKGVSFTLNKGEVLSILGSSGGGKTTLLRCINFLEFAESGKILIDGKTIFDGETAGKLKEEEIRQSRLHFGLVSLIQFLTVTVLSLAAALIFELPIAVGSILPAMPEILYLGICSSGVAYTLQIIGQKHTHPAAASIILCMESVVGAIASVIILGESLSAREYIGCATVLFAVIISQVDPFSLMKSRKRMANSVQNQ